MQSAVVSAGGRRLQLRWRGGGCSDFPAVWLRDNCRCSSCFTADTLHVRTLLMEHLDVSCTVTEAQLSAAGEEVTVTWSDGHGSAFSAGWLRDRAFEPAQQRARALLVQPPRVFWDATLAADLPRAQFTEVMSEDAALLDALLKLEQYGLVLLENAPCRPGPCKQLGQRIAFMRTTHFGEEFTVRLKMDPTNLAYTSRNIEIHSDVCYYDYMPGIQMLHFIVQYHGEGGATLLTDAGRVCQDLRDHYPEHLRTLTTVPVDFTSVTRADDNRQYFKLLQTPVITLDAEGELKCLRFTTSQRDSHFSIPLEDVEPWYTAMKKLLDMLYDEKYIIKRKMNEGDMIVFDNVRLVHGRQPLLETDKTSQRHLEGGYLDWDEVRSRRRVLQERLAGNPQGYGF